MALIIDRYSAQHSNYFVRVLPVQKGGPRGQVNSERYSSVSFANIEDDNSDKYRADCRAWMKSKGCGRSTFATWRVSLHPAIIYRFQLIFFSAK